MNIKTIDYKGKKIRVELKKDEVCIQEEGENVTFNYSSLGVQALAHEVFEQKVEFFDVFSVYSTKDEYGRRGVKVGDFRSFAVAEAYAHGRGWYGGKGDVAKSKAVSILGKVYLLQDPSPIDLDGEQKARDDLLRQETIASLSDDQLRVLGIKTK